jgi:zinc/manganese transport system substrate-binding protein
MKNLLIVLAILLLTSSTFADELNVVTTYPYIANIVAQIGKEKVSVFALAKGEWDPHTIVPKPSFIGKLRKADLLIMNGAQLEIGWLPSLMRQANNPKVQVGTQGLLDLSKSIEMIDAQSSISRAQGDIHPDGNPHYYLDFENVNKIAFAITHKLSEIDPGNKSTYEQNNKIFLEKFDQKKKEWINKLETLKGTKVIEYHKLFDYLIHKIGLDLVGTIEPLPGISPTSRHIQELEKLISDRNVKIILQDVYHSNDASTMLSKKYNIKLIILPHDLGAVKNTDNIFAFYDEIVRRLTND